MERLNKKPYSIIILLLIINSFFVTRCDESPSSIKKQSQEPCICKKSTIDLNDPIFTNIDIDGDQSIIVVKYKKGSAFSKEISRSKCNIYSIIKDGDKRWSFHMKDVLNSGFDYEIIFNNSLGEMKFRLYDIVMIGGKFYAMNETACVCTLASYKVNGKFYTSGNVELYM